MYVSHLKRQNSLVLSSVVRDWRLFYSEVRGRDHTSLWIFHEQSVVSRVLAPDLWYMKRGYLISEVDLVFRPVHESLAVLEPSQLCTEKPSDIRYNNNLRVTLYK